MKQFYIISMCQIFAQSLQKFKALSSITQLNGKLSNSQNHTIININLLKVWQKTAKDKANSPNKKLNSGKLLQYTDVHWSFI